MTVQEIAAAVGGTAHGTADVTAGAFLDTRSPVAGGLYVAVAGERVDGHDFAPDALAAGAAAVLGSREVDGPCVVVDDVVAALGRLARHVLDRLPEVRVLALTGSQGKTGVKDYLATVLEGSGATVATAGNNNNELGVPLTVLRADAATRFLVVEMGARGIGHIAYLCRIAPPEVAAVLNVGTAHVGEFGSRAAIAQAKGEIVEALPAGGTAVLNAGDPLVAAMSGRTAARVVTFGGAGQAADVHAADVVVGADGCCSFTLLTPGASAPVTLRQVGRHQVDNALAAAAMALSVGVGPDEVASRLSAATARSRWRLEVLHRADGLVVVNDAYNANPESMRAGLDALADLGAGRRRVAVLGEMFELGAGSSQAHAAVGAYAAGLGTEVVLAVGEGARAIADGAAATAGWQGDAVVTAGREEALAWLVQNGSAADVVLVKASRGAALEKIVEGLTVEGNSSR